MTEHTMIINSLPHLYEFLKDFKNLWQKYKYITIKITLGKPKTPNQNRLYQDWITMIQAHFQQGGYPTTRAGLHAMLCFKFLGTFEQEIEGQNYVMPRSTTTPKKLTAVEMSNYLSQVQVWALDHGLNLPQPRDENYHEIKANILGRQLCI